MAREQQMLTLKDPILWTVAYMNGVVVGIYSFFTLRGSNLIPGPESIYQVALAEPILIFTLASSAAIIGITGVLLQLNKDLYD